MKTAAMKTATFAKLLLQSDVSLYKKLHIKLFLLKKKLTTHMHKKKPDEIVFLCFSLVLKAPLSESWWSLFQVNLLTLQHLY